MNTLENEVDVLLQECAKELIAQDAAVLDATEEIPVPEKLRLRAVKAMKKAKKEAKPTSPFFRFARVAVASLVAAVCLATASIVYATYTRPEIWGIDIVDNGDHYVVSIVSTLNSKSVIEEKKEPVIDHFLYTKNVFYENSYTYILKYTVDSNERLEYTQYCSSRPEMKFDDDCVFEEIWIKNDKALFIDYTQSNQTGVWWFDGEYYYTIISYDGLSSTELAAIAESVS